MRNRPIKTHCPQGHELWGKNLITRPNGRRECRKCKATQAKAYRQTPKGKATTCRNLIAWAIREVAKESANGQD